MPIVDTDIEHRYSGGAANTDPDDSIGGDMSTAGGGLIVTNTLNNDMDDITSAEATAGITIYHGYYYLNTHATLSYIDPHFWIDSQSSSADTAVAIAMADEAKNVSIETLADEETPPAVVSFTAPANYAAGLLVTTLDPDDFRGHWVRYLVSPAAAPFLDSYTLAVQGDSNP